MNVYMYRTLYDTCMYLIVIIHCVIYLISKCFFLTVDFSRVVLKTVEGVEGSDYINASYIDVR